MALGSTNVSAAAINTELGRSSTATISWNDGDLRKLGSTGNSGQSLTSGTTVSAVALRGAARAFATVGSESYNISYTSLLGNYVPGKTWSTVTVNGGVVIGSSSTGSYALNITGTSGDIHELVNNGYIVGSGGRGGDGGGNGGGGGGPAIFTSYPISITNNGAIWGGGGGGGGGNHGGDGSKYPAFVSGGGGGGGAGQVAGGGGNPGGSGGSISSGGGGRGPAGTAGGGGSGGGPGEGGGGAGGPGGGAGNYIDGNGFVSWLNGGDRRGGAS